MGFDDREVDDATRKQRERVGTLDGAQVDLDFGQGAFD